MSRSSQTSWHNCYELTSLNREAVEKKAFLTWETKPSSFKRYPDFCFGYDLTEHEALAVLDAMRCVTSVEPVTGKPYYRLNTPSAGNLHPLELYVQIRGIKGILSGIYHLDVVQRRIVLIRDIEADGVELYVGMEERFGGMIVMLSSVYFRSYWKYGLRSWRYIYMDAGHQIGAMEAALALHSKTAETLWAMDTKALNRFMGFDAQEQVVAAFAIGTPKSRAAKALDKPLMRVQPTDYFEADALMEGWLEHTKPYSGSMEPGYEGIDHGVLETAIHKRRSARIFTGQGVDAKQHEALTRVFEDMPEHISVTYLLIDTLKQKAVLYRDGKPVESDKGWEHAQTVTQALLGQGVVASSAMVLFFTSEDFNETLLMDAGRLGHRVYLHAQMSGLGCSGVGAFYEEELHEILEQPYVLYSMVIGVG